MQVVKSKIGNAEVLIQSVDEDIDILGETVSADVDRSVSQSKAVGASRHVSIADAFDQAKGVIFSVAEQCGQEYNSLPVKPSEFSLEFSLKFAGKGNAWVFSFEGESVLKVSMAWKDQ
jgi:hypothetical protein